MLRSVKFTDPLRTQTGSTGTIARLSVLCVQLDGYGYVTVVQLPHHYESTGDGFIPVSEPCTGRPGARQVQWLTLRAAEHTRMQPVLR